MLESFRKLFLNQCCDAVSKLFEDFDFLEFFENVIRFTPPYWGGLMLAQPRQLFRLSDPCVRSRPPVSFIPSDLRTLSDLREFTFNWSRFTRKTPQTLHGITWKILSFWFFFKHCTVAPVSRKNYATLPKSQTIFYSHTGYRFSI